MLATQICVVAGPRSIGKSRFIERCGPAAAAWLPPALGAHFAHRPPVISLRRLGRHRHARLPAVTVHVDLFTPFQDLGPLPPDELARAITAEGFAAFPHLECLADATRLLTVTLRAPRTVVQGRWLDRTGGGGAAKSNLAKIYAGPSDKPFNRLYDAWSGFLDALPVEERWHADVTTTQEALTRERP